MNRSLPHANPWLPLPASGRPANLTLFCFPYSGAAASLFFPWVEAFPPGVEVRPVQFPGRGTRLSEPLLTRLPALVEAAAAALRPHFDRPFAFFGHSLGAIVCFELARTLRAAFGLQPERLIVSGHGAPEIPDRHPPLHPLPEAEFIEQLRSLNGTPEDVFANQELRELILPILRADFEVCETYTYTPGEPIDCSLTAFGGLRDIDVPRLDLEAWRAHTRGPFSLRMFPGDHFFLNTDRPTVIAALARELSAYFR